MVELVAYWGNGDAESRIKVSNSLWEKIKDGKLFNKNSSGYYEGRRFRVFWVFENKKFTILDLYEQSEKIYLEPIENLYIIKSEKR